MSQHGKANRYSADFPHVTSAGTLGAVPFQRKHQSANLGSHCTWSFMHWPFLFQRPARISAAKDSTSRAISPRSVTTLRSLWGTHAETTETPWLTFEQGLTSSLGKCTALINSSGICVVFTRSLGTIGLLREIPLLDVHAYILMFAHALY